MYVSDGWLTWRVRAGRPRRETFRRRFLWPSGRWRPSRRPAPACPPCSTWLQSRRSWRTPSTRPLSPRTASWECWRHLPSSPAPTNSKGDAVPTGNALQCVASPSVARNRRRKASSRQSLPRWMHGRGEQCRMRRSRRGLRYLQVAWRTQGRSSLPRGRNESSREAPHRRLASSQPPHRQIHLANKRKQ